MKRHVKYLMPPSASLFLAATLLAVSATGCQQASGNRDQAPPVKPGQKTSSLDGRPLITLSFVDTTETVLSTKAHQPLLNYLTARTPFRYRTLFSSESERNVGVLEERLVEISHLGVVSYLEAHQQFGAVPIAKTLNRDGEPISRSVLVTREDTDIRKLTELSGRSLALGSFHSTLSNLVPRNELIQAGIDLEDLQSIERLANDEEVARAVLAGRFDAGAVADTVAERYEQKGLRAFHVSGPVPTGPLAIRDDLPRRVESAIREALLKLAPRGAEGRQDWAEEIRYGFQPAADSDYEPIRKIMKTVPTGCTESCHGSS